MLRAADRRPEVYGSTAHRILPIQLVANHAMFWRTEIHLQAKRLLIRLHLAQLVSSAHNHLTIRLAIF